MKKVFLLMTLTVAAALSAWATNYSEFITITINGETTEPIPSTVTLEQEEGLSTYSFTLRNFILPGETDDDNMYVGNVQLTGLTLIGASEEKTFATTQNITILNGDDPEKPWIGSFLGDIPVTVNGRVIGETEALVIIDIDLMSSLGQIITVTFANQNIYQMANSDFEDWENVSYSGKTGEEPIYWSSFLDGTGNLKSMAGYNQLEKSEDKPAGSTGTYSAKLTSRAVKLFGKTIAVAQGNLTNGCINMGSTTATDATGNYNYINTSRADQSMRFSGMPDAVKVWVKHNGGTKSANVATLFTTNGYYQDPVANNITATKVASAIKNDIPSNNTWTEYTIPVTYESGVSVRPYYVLITLSTCAEAGAGAEADYTFFDDITMVYNCELTGAKYDNVDINFVAGTATIDEVYEPSKLTDLTSNGHGATIVPAYNEETALLTISVYADNFVEDVTNFHTYTIQFAKNYSRDVTVDNYGTICLPAAVAAADREGATFYNIAGVLKNSNGEYMSIVLEEVEEGTALVAGKPYIFKASAAQINLTMKGAQTSDVQEANGLVGHLCADDQVPNGKYVISGDKFYLVDSNVTLKQYRAYIDANQISDQAGAPSRRVVLGIDGVEEVTAIEDTEAAEIIKFIENGQILIKKNGHIYNMMGQIIK